MSSILTNNSAMVALDTLRGINKSLGSVQNEISTGQKVSSSTDNAAIWSIATVMQSDVDSFSQVSDSLNLGSATVGVAQSAADQVTDLLTTAKETIVAASDASISDSERAKYDVDLKELTATIGSIVDAASLNGTNLLKAGGDANILSALNRDGEGDVTAAFIDVARKDLTTTAFAAAVTEVAEVTGGTIDSTDAVGATLVGNNASETGAAEPTLTITAGTTESATTYTIDFGQGAETFEIAAGRDQDQVASDLAAELTTRIAASSDTNIADNLTAVASGATITFSNAALANSGNDDIAIAIGATSNASVTGVAASDEVAAGGLAALATLDISNAAGAATALGAIDDLLQTAIDATAHFGSKQTRIDNQNEFITTLSDSLKTGIGALTDANLEEASARLQSLQVQQQLGVQSLSIANQAPQQLLSLFR